MNVVWIVIGILIYLVIGRIIAEKRWEWDGYDYMMEDTGIVLTTIFWPFYILWVFIRLVASIFVDID